MTIKKKALGRGLAALLGDDETVYSDNTHFLDRKESILGSKEIKEVSLELITPNKDQPRKTIDKKSLGELAASIKEHGVLQPIIVQQKKEEGTYEIIAGERRWRASHIAGCQTIPIIEHKINTVDRMKIALVENIQRADLSALEEAMAYESLMELYSFTQGMLAETLGKSRSYIANILRLNKLSSAAKKALSDKQITYGHARCLVGVSSKEAENYLSRIIENNLNVRETENLFKKVSKKKKNNSSVAVGMDEKPEDIKTLEREMSTKLGANVDICLEGSEKKITIYIDDFNHFDSVLGKIS